MVLAAAGKEPSAKGKGGNQADLHEGLGFFHMFSRSLAGKIMFKTFTLLHGLRWLSF